MTTAFPQTGYMLGVLYRRRILEPLIASKTDEHMMHCCDEANPRGEPMESNRRRKLRCRHAASMRKSHSAGGARCSACVVPTSSLWIDTLAFTFARILAPARLSYPLRYPCGFPFSRGKQHALLRTETRTSFRSSSGDDDRYGHGHGHGTVESSVFMRRRPERSVSQQTAIRKRDA